MKQGHFTWSKAAFLFLEWLIYPNTNPSDLAGYDTRSIFGRSLIGLISDYSFSKTSCLTKAEEPSLSYYLPIAGGRIIGFIPFPKVLVLCEIQSASSRIWTRVAVSIPYDDNHCTTGTSFFFFFFRMTDLPKLKNPDCSTIFLIARSRKGGFILFLKV